MADEEEDLQLAESELDAVSGGALDSYTTINGQKQGQIKGQSSASQRFTPNEFVMAPPIIEDP